MTVRYKTDDILKEDVDALVNPVNCEGVMGRGLASQFKRAFQGNFKAYARACRKRDVRPGRMFVFPVDDLVCRPRFIINFPTKRHWRDKSRMEDIESGLEDLAAVVRDRGIRSVAIPALGSGLGGLDWDQVRPKINAALKSIDDVDVIVFGPGGAHDSATESSG